LSVKNHMLVYGKAEFSILMYMIYTNFTQLRWT